MTDFLSALRSYRITGTTAAPSPRVFAVDALRGFDMIWIIGGKKIVKGLDSAVDSPFTNWLFSQLDHAPWYGFTFYDIIMPLFLFLVGIAMVYSTGKRLASGDSRALLWKHILIRVVVLWILGMMVQGKLLTYDLEQIRLYSNTLQAIAAGYLIASLFILYLPLLAQIGATAGLMLATWAVYAVIPGPGGMYEPEGNIALHIDRIVLGGFQDGTTYTWILSSLNFGATTMLGVFTGYLLRTGARPVRMLGFLALGGVTLILVSFAWMPWHPMIKHLWTGSFVLYSGGICILLLAAFYLVTDVLGYRAWAAFLVVVGSNAIFAYVSASIFDYRLVAAVFLGGLERYTGDWQPFILALGGFAVLYGVLYTMYRKKIFIKI
jgi:predicted acyltransferase